MMTKIYIGNLPETCRRTDLLALFEKYGKVTECDIIKNYGFVHMETDQDAKAAIDGLNEYDFQGTQISVELSRSKVRPQPGMGGNGQCYKCGRSGHWSKDCRSVPNRGRRDGRYGYGERPMPGYRDQMFGRYPPFPPDRMRPPYMDPYERRPPPPLEREYFRSRSPFSSPRYPPSEYYYRRSPPRYSSSQFMSYDYEPFEFSSRGRYHSDRFSPPPMRPRVNPY